MEGLLAITLYIALRLSETITGFTCISDIPLSKNNTLHSRDAYHLIDGNAILNTIQSDSRESNRHYNVAYLGLIYIPAHRISQCWQSMSFHFEHFPVFMVFLTWAAGYEKTCPVAMSYNTSVG